MELGGDALEARVLLRHRAGGLRLVEKRLVMKPIFERWNSTIRSSETGSLFFSSMPTTEYVTGPTKWTTVNASRTLGILSRGLSLCVVSSLPSSVASEPLGTTHSSLIVCRPPGRPPISHTTPELSMSVKSASGSSMPSAAFSSCTAAKTASLNVACSRSLQLMQSCSGS